MIPIHDYLRSRSFPFVNYGLIIANFLVFFYELTRPDLNAWISTWGATPCLVNAAMHGSTVATCSVNGSLGQFTYATNPYPPLTLLTSIFIHAGWLHILGNMLFLWVFGDNIEDAFGHAGYLGFYLVCGLGAGLGQIYSSNSAAIPSVGASGAIAGVLGAYLILYPRAKVETIIPIFIIPWFVKLPAFIVMLVWFATQVLSSNLFAVANAMGGSGGVAYIAHIVGFLMGMAIALPLRGRRRSIDPSRRIA
jgi:membrane associated rhomboid family serine protease